MTLGDFLKRECGNHAPWNCSCLPADWAMECGHPDFAAEWRSITEPQACDATAAQAGGLLALWEQGIGSGLPVAADREPGDIAVLTAAGVEAGGIWTGERWAVRTLRGLAFLGGNHIRVLKAWRP